MNVTAPLFIMMALGYLLKCLKVLDGGFLRKLNDINFKIFLPVMIFNNLYKTDITQVWNGTAVLIAVGSFIIIFGLLMITVPAVEKDNPRRSVIIGGIFRSNYSYIGIPVAAAICGSVNAGLSAIILAVITPLYNAAAVVSYEIFTESRVSAAHILGRIIKNPLIIASVLGIIGMLLKLRFPDVIDKTVTDLSKLCTPLALITIGGFFDFRTLKGNTKTLVLTTVIRLIVIPAVFFTASALLGMRGDNMAALFALFATPTAVSSFTFAQIMGGDANLAGQMVIVQSCASIATMFLWVLVLSSFGIF